MNIELGGELAESLDISSAEHHTLHEGCQTTGAAGTYVAGCSHDEQCRFAEASTLHRAHLPDALNDETNSQRIAGGEDRAVSFGKLIEVALDENGTESAETHDLCSGLNRAGRRCSNAGEVFARVACVQAVGRNEGVDVEAARLR